MHDLLHVGHHGHAQGRDAVARERGGVRVQRVAAAGRAPPHRARRARVLPAARAHAGALLRGAPATHFSYHTIFIHTSFLPIYYHKIVVYVYCHLHILNINCYTSLYKTTLDKYDKQNCLCYS